MQLTKYKSNVQSIIQGGFPLLLPKFHLSISIYTKDLVKKYRSRSVVNHVSIEVNQGEIVGLLGPNGAGKTTTFYMTVGLISPDEGVC